jgi:hypothetical protein
MRFANILCVCRAAVWPAFHAHREREKFSEWLFGVLRSGLMMMMAKRCTAVTLTLLED